MVAINNNASVLLQTMMYIMNQSSLQEDTSYNYYLMDIGKESNATKCYGIYGCFELTSPWTSEHRPVSLFPEEISKIEPKFPFYTRENRVKPRYFDLNEDEVILSSGIEPTKPVYLISHGYMEGGGIDWIYEMGQELLNLEDCTVVIVDWHGGSGPPYTQAVANIRLVAAITAHLLGDLVKHTGDLKLDHVHCIGHSLGAHLSGYIGYTLQKEFNVTLGRITGLDPAEPHFAKAKPPVRLDRSAAKFVDIVHTDASQFLRGGLGITEHIGHIDYFPNGGTNQPGCGKSVVEYISGENGSFFKGVRKYLGCNHLRSHEYFTESINPKCSFLSVSCTSYKDFISGKCFDCGERGARCLQFGYHSKKHYERLVGNFPGLRHRNIVQYLITGDRRPYCMGHYKVFLKISSSEDSRRHGGEIGQIILVLHSTSDGKGYKSKPVILQGGYHEPGGSFTGVVAAEEIPQLRAVEVEWKYNSSFFNPLTWRILATPRIYLEQVTVEALNREKITVCPKDRKPLVNGFPQLMISSYC